MGKIFKVIIAFLYLAVLFYLMGCSSISPWLLSIPKADIIFQTTMNVEPYNLNFIQADGSSVQSITLKENFVKPMWSRDYTVLYGLSSPAGQPPYEDLGYPVYWDLKNGEFKKCDNNLHYYGQIEGYDEKTSVHEVLLSNAEEIILFDLDVCQQKQKFIDKWDNPGELTIIGFSYFPEKQELVYGEATNPDEASREYHLIKWNLNTGEKVDLAEGVNPAWSPDGSQIAYIGLDGLYVIQANGNQSLELVKTKFFDPWRSGSPWYLAPQPRWSPDGKWLVYHQCIDLICDVLQTPIYKIQVSDGMQVKIFTGGKFPIWQP
jgi:hypothetical protein